jgi:transcriptional regulator with XRE-family HTH domain
MAKEHSFADYISKRFDNNIFNSLSSYIEEVKENDFDRLDLRLRKIRKVGTVELYDTKTLKVDAYDLPGSEVGFDIRVEAHILVHEGDYHLDEAECPQQWFVLRCTGDLEKDLDDFAVNSIEIYSSKNNYKNKLYDSLVPVINHADYEQAAIDFLKKYYPKGLVQPGYIDPMEVAKGMGLNVVLRSITEDCSIFGQVYFRDCDAELYNGKTGEMEMVHVPAGTIIADKNTFFLYNFGKFNNTIIHECVHWAFHRKAFELDRLCNKYETSMIGCRVVGGVKGRESNAVSIMERQANALTPRIQMPMGAFKTRAIKWIREYRERTGRNDLIDIIQPVIDALSNDFHVSRLAAKIRMVEAGYEEAIGAFNWIDDHYVATHRFKKGSLKPNQTFTIGPEDLARQLVSNPKLKDIVSDGTYLYVDSHLVLADSKYLCTDAEGMTVLTDYARNHMDECCLAFDMTVEGCDDNEYYTVCYLNKDKDAKVILNIAYTDGLQFSSPERQKQVLENFVLRYANLYKTFTTDYVDCLQKAFKDSGMTYKELADDIGMNSDVVSRIINGKNDPAVESLALICLGLKLPYKLSNHIFQYSPCNLLYVNESHIWIDVALQTMAGQSMRSIKEFLNEHNVFL